MTPTPDYQALITEARQHPRDLYPTLNAVADALEDLLSPIPDEQLDAIEAEVVRMREVGLDFHADQAADLLAEVRRLRDWKQSAMTVLSEWEQTWDEAGRPGKLGGSKAVGVREEIARLRVLSAHPTEETDHPDAQDIEAMWSPKLVRKYPEKAFEVMCRLAANPTGEQVTTVAQLDALPVGSVVRTEFHGFVAAKRRIIESEDEDDFDPETGEGRAVWWLTGLEDEYTAAALVLSGPARVLFRPVPEGSETA